MIKNVNGIDIEMTPEEEADFLASIASFSIPTVGDYQNAIQSLIDRTAVTKQFNDGVSLASYKDSTVPLWAAQATEFIAWRDAVWVYVYGEMSKVQLGQRPQPSIADILAELPVIQWPA